MKTVKRLNMGIKMSNNYYTVHRFALTLQPEYERIDAQGRVNGYYQWPIATMENSQLKELVEQAFSDLSLNVRSYEVDHQAGTVEVEVGTKKNFFDYHFNRVTTSDQIVDYIIEHFNTDLKEETWRVDGTSFQFININTGQTLTAHLDLTVVNVEQLPDVTEAVTTTLPQDPGMWAHPMGQSGMTFGPITSTAIPIGSISPASGPVGPSRTAPISPLLPAVVSPVLPAPVSPVLPAVVSEPIDPTTIFMTQVAATKIIRSASVVKYIQTNRDGTITHYYRFRPVNDKPFIIEIEFDLSGQPYEQIRLIYGMADPNTTPKHVYIQTIQVVTDKEQLSVLRQLAGRYPHLLGMIDSVQL